MAIKALVKYKRQDGSPLEFKFPDYPVQLEEKITGIYIQIEEPLGIDFDRIKHWLVALNPVHRKKEEIIVKQIR